MDAPCEHPDWYDLHDTTHSAGPGREPEHYQELLLALPPLDKNDHLIDVGAGTGKLALIIAKGYPRLGQLTLIEPNESKIERAEERLREALPHAQIHTIVQGMGDNTRPLSQSVGSIATIGSVLMPTMELNGGTLGAGLHWLRIVLGEVKAMLRPGGWLYTLETLAAPWAHGDESDPVRRLHMPELTAEFTQAGFSHVECTYRFRDRVVIRAQKPGE
jgi:SAM-dependent methyltransferase